MNFKTIAIMSGVCIVLAHFLAFIFLSAFGISWGTIGCGFIVLMCYMVAGLCVKMGYEAYFSKRW